jgi:large subunit ribosomal protein L10
LRLNEAFFIARAKKGTNQMPKTRIQKEDAVAKLKVNLSKANSVVFTDYKGMTMSQLSDLRNKLREDSAELSVTKNNLIKIALKESSIEVLDEKVFEGPMATLFAYGEEIGPIKTLTKSLKDSQIGTVKGGLLNGEYMNSMQINKLATLPSRDELRAKVVGSLGAPLYGIVGVLQANLRNLVYALDQIRIAKGGE